MIRDLGATLAMRPEPATVRMVLNSQMAKAGPPTDGKDFGYGDLDWGILLPASPLTIATLTLAGMAMAFSRDGRAARRRLVHRRRRIVARRVARSDQPLRRARLPAIFCVQNNQTALSTPVADQSAVRTFADKAAGYGVPGITVDGTDPEAIAGAFGWAAERARAGLGPALIELVAMRLCGHAHHDDMLYLGRDPQTSWEIPPLAEQGYANRELYEYWAARDPIALYAAKLTAEGILEPGDLDRFKREAEALVETEARAIIDAPWPEPSQAGIGVFKNEKPRVHVEVLDPRFPSRTQSRHENWSLALRGFFRPCRGGAAVRSERADLPRRRDARRRRRAAERSARVRLRRGRRRASTATRFCCCGRCSRNSATASSTRRSPKARCSASASARRWRGSGRSARSSSTTSSRPASTSS